MSFLRAHPVFPFVGSPSPIKVILPYRHFPPRASNSDIRDSMSSRGFPISVPHGDVTARMRREGMMFFLEVYFSQKLITSRTSVLKTSIEKCTSKCSRVRARMIADFTASRRGDHSVPTSPILPLLSIAMPSKRRSSGSRSI